MTQEGQKMDSGKFTEEILTILKERMGDVEIMACDVTRNNGIRLAGLTIRDRACNIAPCITLEDFCLVHSEGRKNLGDIVDEIIQVYQKNKAGHCFDLSAFTDYSHAKTLLHGRLINTEKNAGLLEKRPHREFLDLSLVYCMEFPCPDIGGAGSMQVMDAHMGLWEVSEQELYRQAMENMGDSEEAAIYSMADIFAGMQECLPETAPGKAFPMYILTNRRKFYGAAQILNRKALEKAAGMAGQGFFILPSSVHEAILVPEGETDACPEDLAAMVHEVNEAEVPEEEYLSGHVYHYCATDGKITIVA